MYTTTKIVLLSAYDSGILPTWLLKLCKLVNPWESVSEIQPIAIKAKYLA